MKKHENEYIITPEEKEALLFALLKQEVGYKKACDLFEEAVSNYDPIEYAVIKATKEIEKR